MSDVHTYEGYDKIKCMNYTCKHIGDMTYDSKYAWHSSGKLHCTDGPAVEWSNENKEYYMYGKRHREDGPAIECINGYKYYYIRGFKYSFNDYKNKISKMEMDIALPSKYTEEICLITLDQLKEGDKYDECPSQHVSICNEDKGIYKVICPYCKQKYIGRFIQTCKG